MVSICYVGVNNADWNEYTRCSDITAFSCQCTK
jgi:hypothetical protein